jgi:tetratricopeptide (TPR) repeat protein
MNFRRALWSRRALAVVVPAAVGGVFAGLGYEGSLVCAPVFAALGASVGVETVARGRVANAAAFVWPARELGILLGLTLAVLAASSLWPVQCLSVRGLLLFVLGPGCSAVTGWVVGLWGGTLADRPVAGLSLAAVVPGLCAAIGLLRAFAWPVMFDYDPFFGLVFAGVVGGEPLPDLSTYVAYRGVNLLAGFIVLVMWRYFVDPRTLRIVPRLRSHAHRVGLATVALAVGWGMGVADRLGFTTSTRSLRASLSGEHRTEHFVLHYEPGARLDWAIAELAAEHEFAWTRLAAALGREPEPPLHVYVYSSAEQKRRLLGAAFAEFANSRRDELYLDPAYLTHATVHHEVAHLFALTLFDPQGPSVFERLTLPGGVFIGEGVATALAVDDDDAPTLEERAVTLASRGALPPLSRLQGLGFWTTHEYGYNVAGAFFRWLIAHHGTAPLQALYATHGDFVAAYGRSLADLEDAWRTSVTTEAARLPAASDGEERPGAALPGVRCPEAAATLLEAARGAARAGLFARNAELHARHCAIVVDPHAALQQVWAELWAGDRTAAERTLAAAEKLPADPDFAALVTAARGELALAAGRHVEAAELYQRALASDLSPAWKRWLHLQHLAATTPALRGPLRRYGAARRRDEDGWDAALEVAQVPGQAPLGNFLLARALHERGQAGEAASAWRRSLHARTGEQPLPDGSFTSFAERNLLAALVERGDLDGARTLLATFETRPRRARPVRTEVWHARIAARLAGDRSARSRPSSPRLPVPARPPAQAPPGSTR